MKFMFTSNSMEICTNELFKLCVYEEGVCVLCDQVRSGGEQTDKGILFRIYILLPGRF